MSSYDFLDLANKAISTNAEQDIAALAEWCDRYGETLWNGECYDVSLPDEPTGTRSLRPIYGAEDEDGNFPIVGWELS